jgi:hypothetical protein
MFDSLSILLLFWSFVADLSLDVSFIVGLLTEFDSSSSICSSVFNASRFPIVLQKRMF